MSTASDMVAAYTAAELAVLKGQSYTIAGRSLTRANLPEIRAGRREWEAKQASERARAMGRSPLYSVADFRE